MQLSVSSGKHGILQRATFLAFGNSQDHTSDYPLADMVASANRWVQRVSGWLERASGVWDIDDKNQTDIPEATADLVDSQDNYTLPANLVQLKGVEVKDQSGIWSRLQQVDETEVQGALSEFMKTDGLPQYYRVTGDSIILYPAPASTNVTATAGLKIYYTREYTTFNVPANYTTADTTQPGFDEQYHDIVALGISYDWCFANGPTDRCTKIKEEIEAYRLDLTVLQPMKNQDRKSRFNLARTSYE